MENKQKIYVFGKYIDLSDTDPKNLMPKCCCCDSSSGGDVYDNNIFFNSKKNENGEWELYVTSEKDVTSDIDINVIFSYYDDNNMYYTKSINLKLLTNNSSIYEKLDLPSSTKNVSIDFVTITPNSDEEYKYSTSFEDKNKIFYGVIPINTINNLSKTDIINNFNFCIIEGTEENRLSFNIPPVGVEGIDTIESEEEIEKILKEHAYDLVIIYESNITNFEINDYMGINDSKFIYIKDINIDNTNYSIILRSDPNTQRNVYDTNTGPTPFAPIIYVFNINS